MTVISLNNLPDDISSLRGICGYFHEFTLNSLDDLAPFITSKCQTVTCFGIEPKQVQSFVLDNGLMGVDRIVTFGNAMNISTVWDGYDIIKNISRVVSLK